MTKTIRGVSAQLIRETAEAIERRDGLCHPAAFVAEVENDPELRPLFEWDDATAAQLRRIEEARRVLRTVQIEVKGQEKPVPAFVHVHRVTKEGVADGYASVKALRPGDRAGVLADALKQMNGLRERYEQLSELAPIWEAIDRVQEAASDRV